MRKLIYAINLTIDGCFDHTKMTPSEDMYTYYINLLKNADLLLYGRITYQLMVPYWPDVVKNPSPSDGTNEFAKTFVSLKKAVVSRTLESAEEDDTQIIRTNLKEEITKLKEQPGGNILLGGVDLPSQLIALGLVDEFNFVVHPVLAGDGRRLFEGVNLPEKLKLKLTESKPFGSGCVALHYRKQ
jgi:dihydrofolate reductase